MHLKFPLAYLLVCLFSSCHGDVATKTYIIHVDKQQMPVKFSSHHDWYSSQLRAVSEEPLMLYSYIAAMNGYSAKLSSKEAQRLRNQPGVLSLIEETKYELHTTRTPDFLGLRRPDADDLYGSGSGSDVVIGVLDTGVSEKSRSYDDAGYGPVPDTWKGGCDSGTTCNRKLIGARFFAKGYEAALGTIDEENETRSVEDDMGHGTHTSTTAAGTPVRNASLYGYAGGTARGVAPKSRIAIYKVCWKKGCFPSDIIAAIDQAIADNVSVLSMSIGGGRSEYYNDAIAVGAFAATARGIHVVCSAGNSGPIKDTLSNAAPWITTVGAGTLDRAFPTYVLLGNGGNYTGTAIFSDKSLPENTFAKLVYAGNMSNSSLCVAGSLSPAEISGKIVICERGGNGRIEKGMVVKEAGGVGMILSNTKLHGEEMLADCHVLSSAAVGEYSGDAIKNYVFSDSDPTATITVPRTELGVKPSPVVAAFSSRGPNSVSPEILKPDVIAPGVNILAGWPETVGPGGSAKDTRRVAFNIISGTSMACPHVSGLAALVLGAHSGWSPAAVRSALMTTAYSEYENGGTVVDSGTGEDATPYDFGAGHVDPTAAIDPGLVYDLTAEDYLGFLCGLGYSTAQIKMVSGTNFTCDMNGNYSPMDLNYPSFSIILGGGTVSGRCTRTLTNVGTPGTYRAFIKNVPLGFEIDVEPDIVVFKEVNERKSFTLMVKGTRSAPGTVGFASLEWTDGNHVVRSPIALNWK